MIEFTHETTRYKVKPENVMTLRKLAAKPPKFKNYANKADKARDSLKRDYPAFYVGMTTAEYVRLFNIQFNDGLHKQLSIIHDCANYHESAPMLDPTQPEVWGDLDPNGEDFKHVKKLTAKQAMSQALKALQNGDIDTAQCILAEGLK
jgi:hypothetical protein